MCIRDSYYTYVYNNLKKYDDFCNLGHLNIIDRYAPEIAPFEVYSDIIEAILKHLIETGHGIELNTSSFRYNMKETCPSEAILRPVSYTHLDVYKRQSFQSFGTA